MTPRTQLVLSASSALSFKVEGTLQDAGLHLQRRRALENGAHLISGHHSAEDAGAVNIAIEQLNAEGTEIAISYRGPFNPLERNGPYLLTPDEVQASLDSSAALRSRLEARRSALTIESADGSALGL